MTPTQRAAAERLADALNEGYAYAMDEAAALLRELLAAEPVQEPVAWMMPNTDSIITSATKTYRGVLGEVHSIPLYAALQQRKPLTPSMQAEVECDCLVAWNASTYGHSAQDTVHPMFLSAFISGYRAAERAHGITGEPT